MTKIDIPFPFVLGEIFELIAYAGIFDYITENELEQKLNIHLYGNTETNLNPT